jgi:hypothetical protein
MVVCRQVAGDDEQQLAGALPSRFGVRSISGSSDLRGLEQFVAVADRWS